MTRFIFLIFLTFLANVIEARASEVKVNGFIAQGLAQARNSNFITDEGDVSFKLTEVGINSSYRINSRFRLAGQVVYLDGGNRFPQGFRLDYLFLEWQLLNNQNWQIKTHLGRNKNYHWLYSATRDVPHTRPSIVLPQSLYFDVFRDVALGVDGLAFIAQTSNSQGEWDINLSLGSSIISREEKLNLLGQNASGKLRHDSDKQFSVYWRPTASQWQFGMGLIDADFSYERTEPVGFFDGDEVSKRLMFNFLYQGRQWEIASEVMRERIIIDNLLFPGFHSDITAEGGYLQGRYFYQDDITLLARLDLYDRDRTSRDGKKAEILSQGTVPGYFSFMDQATLGVTWKLANNMQLQAEVHRVKGAARLAPLFSPNVSLNNQKYWNMWAVQLMYWF